MSLSRLDLPAPLGPVRKWNEPASSLIVDVAQHLRPGAIAHADILETDHRGEHGTRPRAA